jgi:hypothetical protein
MIPPWLYQLWCDLPWSQIITSFCGLMGVCFGLLKQTSHRRERRKREIAEEKLAEITRRGNAPFLRPNEAFFDCVYYADIESGQPRRFRVSDGIVLCSQCHEVSKEMPAGQLILFVVDNPGQAIRCSHVELDGNKIFLRDEFDLNDSHDLMFLEYPFYPAKFGQRQTIKFKFETVSGVQDTHLYETEHGRRVLRRVDPS